MCNKEAELGKELKVAKVDLVIIPEMKMLKGTIDLKDYISLYSSVDRNRHAAAGIGIMIRH
jgi:hypothetical protein